MNWFKRIKGTIFRGKKDVGGEGKEEAVPEKSTEPSESNEDLMERIESALESIGGKTEEDVPTTGEEAITTEGEEGKPLQEATDTADPAKENKPPKDAKAEVRVSPDKMTATVILHAPENGGADITAKDVYDELLRHNIAFGIANQVIEQKTGELRYGEPFVAASGIPPKDGADGRVIEHVEREKKISFVENEHGNVDYKNLDLINHVEEGTVLCEIIPPTDPVPGRNIFGTELNGKPGKVPVVPQGENTILVEDGRKLVATKSGHLIYRNGRFSVQIVLEIPQDVDNSTGNIDFCGDVIVKGSVFEGYEIRAEGNVTVYGIVEGVYISAGGNIQLKQGINGMGKGVIEAKGDITCRYLENCTARAGGNINAETIIHSNVYSGASIIVTESRSSIIGGVCSALQSIEVKTIGSRMNTLTTLMLGATNEMIEERRELMAEISKLEQRMNEIALDVKFIEQRMTSSSITEKHRYLLLQYRKEYPEISARLEEARKRADEIEDIIANNVNCRLNCQHIYPPTKIIIGTETIFIQDERNRCVVYYDGEIKFTYI
jgi:uncharacterized protein (DUF342 family)